jgi:hypothetical protein
MRAQFYDIFIMLHLCIVFITTVVKIGNTNGDGKLGDWVRYLVVVLDFEKVV